MAAIAFLLENGKAVFCPPKALCGRTPGHRELFGSISEAAVDLEANRVQPGDGGKMRAQRILMMPILAGLFTFFVSLPAEAGKLPSFEKIYSSNDKNELSKGVLRVASTSVLERGGVPHFLEELEHRRAVYRMSSDGPAPALGR